MQVATDEYSYAAISGITKTAPAVITATGHGVPDGWQVAVVSVVGMRQINAENSPPRGKDFVRATATDVNTVTLNAVNSADYSTYTSGGYLQFQKPMDLTGFIARMSIKDAYGGTVLASSSAADAPLNVITMAVNTTLHTVTATIAAASTNFSWSTGVFEVELESSGGVVTSLYSGTVEVTKEVNP